MPTKQQILALEQQKVISQIELYKVLGGGATLSAPQIVWEPHQEAAMQSARIATKDEVIDGQSERSPKTIKAVPKTIAPSAQATVVESNGTEPPTLD